MEKCVLGYPQGKVSKVILVHLLPEASRLCQAICAVARYRPQVTCPPRPMVRLSGQSTLRHPLPEPLRTAHAQASLKSDTMRNPRYPARQATYPIMKAPGIPPSGRNDTWEGDGKGPKSSSAPPRLSPSAPPAPPPLCSPRPSAHLHAQRPFQKRPHALVMRALPIDLAAVGALAELVVVAAGIGR